MKKQDWVRAYLKEEVSQLEKKAGQVGGFTLSWEPFPDAEPIAWQATGLYMLSQVLRNKMPDFEYTLPEESTYWVGTSTCTKTFPSEDSRKLLINESVHILRDLGLGRIELQTVEGARANRPPIKITSEIANVDKLEKTSDIANSTTKNSSTEYQKAKATWKVNYFKQQLKS